MGGQKYTSRDWFCVQKNPGSDIVDWEVIGVTSFFFFFSGMQGIAIN